MVLPLIIILAQEICSRQSTTTDHDPDPSLSLTAKTDPPKYNPWECGQLFFLFFFFWHGCHGLTWMDLLVKLWNAFKSSAWFFSYVSILSDRSGDLKIGKQVARRQHPNCSTHLHEVRPAMRGELEDDAFSCYRNARAVWLFASENEKRQTLAPTTISFHQSQLVLQRAPQSDVVIGSSWRGDEGSEKG